MQNQAAIGGPRIFIGFILAALLLLTIVALLHNTTNSATAAAPAGCTAASVPVAPVTTGAFTEYPMPHTQSDLMSPALDAQGNLWFGEMGGNRLGMLNPTTRVITEWAPPGGESGIMGITTDQAGNIWFAEEAASALYRFTPSTCSFTNYPLPKRDGYAAAPNGVAFAADGTLWFTQFGNDTIGALNPTTGKMRQYPLPKTNTPPAPYGIAVDDTGAVWFTELGAAAIGRLDPATGTVTTLPLAQTDEQPNTITRGPDGTLWFTVMSGILGTIDPASQHAREIPVPANMGSVAQLYDVQAASDGTLWLTSSGANALLHYMPQTNTWTKATLPRDASAPYGIALDPRGSVWVTEGALGANRIAQYRGQ